MKYILSFFLIGIILTLDTQQAQAECGVIIENPRINEIEPQERFVLDSQDSYRYFTFGTGPIFYIPNVGVGNRYRIGHYGQDYALNIASVIAINQLMGSAIYHYYFDEFNPDAFYVGAGGTASMIFSDRVHFVTISPTFVLGKEIFKSSDNRHFVELQLHGPFAGARPKKIKKLDGAEAALVYMRYGMSY